MPIIDLQRRLTEVGRIRMGATVTSGGKSRPARLEKWRFTSRDQHRLQAVAQLYGGEVKSWDRQDGHFLVDSAVDAFPIMLMPGQSISQWYELWSGGGCQRRCDGRTETIGDQACLCGEYTDRIEAAKEGKACKPTTRLSVLLPEIPGIGCWRLETHGYYAAVELAGVSELLEEATRRGALLPARLRIDQRHEIKAGQTKRYPVPVIDIDVRIPEMLAAAQSAAPGEIATPPRAELPAGEPERPVFKPIAPVQGPGVKEALAATAPPADDAPRRANAAEPLGPAGADFDTDPIPVGDDPVSSAPPPAAPKAPEGEPEVLVASDAQRRLLWATVRERGVSEDQVREILRDVTGQESSAGIPKSKFSDVLTAVQGVQVAAA